MANIRLNALNELGIIISLCDEEYRTIDAVIYETPNGPKKDSLIRKREAASKLRGRYKYRRFKLKNHMRKKNEYNATKSYA